MMPALFCLALAPALRKCSDDWHARGVSHQIYAYLDDIYVWVEDRRFARAVFEDLQACLRTGPGLDLHVEKTKLWGPNPVCPPNWSDMPEVWCPEGLAIGAEEDGEGLRVLGAPIGSDAYVRNFCEKRTQLEQNLYVEIEKFVEHTRDVQIAFQLLKFCCATRSVHLARTVLPSLLRNHAHATDQKLETLFAKLLSMPPETLTEFQKALLHAPSRYSGFGIRSLEAISPAAYWGGFAAALPILHDHAPPVATRLLQQLEAPEQVDQPEAPHVHELKDIDAELRRLGFLAPSWADLASGTVLENPEEVEEADPGEWKRGWQYLATDTLEKAKHDTRLGTLNPTTVAKFRYHKRARPPLCGSTPCPPRKRSIFQQINFAPVFACALSSLFLCKSAFARLGIVITN